AREQVDRQATQLRTAYKVNEIIQRDLDLDRTVDAIARALVDEAEFAGAELEISAHVGDVAVARAVHRGVTEGQALTRALEVQGEGIGELRVFPKEDADRAEHEDLLAFIVPTVAMALHNALSFHAVQDYRRGLERRVEERTHDLSLARDELAATVKSREKLFQNISHEFRTPLSLILLSVDTLLAAAHNRDDTAAAAHHTTVTTSARKLVRMVDELLLLAAGRERELTVHAEPLDLHAAITASAAGWRLAAEAAGLSLVVTCPTSLPVSADPIALERVLANLLSNAVKFSPPGGTISIVVTPGDRVAVEVADTGIGIDDDLRGRLFGRFEQGKGGIASRGGSGIGLSLTRELVRAHGGDIECLPNPGGGTIFRFTLATATSLPATGMTSLRLAPGDYGVSTGTETVPSRIEARGTSLGTILLAEDDLALAGSIARLLAGDYTILVAHDGSHALALAEQHHPDLLVTDVQMPGMDGFELTRRFREMPGVPPAPVLVLTARAGMDDRLTGFGVGAVDYLTKPFDPVELRARVRSQLAHRELTRQLYDAEKLASLGAMSAGLAHELRNPANGIVNAVAPLKEMLPPEFADPDHPVTQLIDVMAECADQVAYLSRQLLGFRRSGELDLRRVPVGDVIDRALANASAALSGMDLRNKQTYTGPIRCAAPVMSQVLTNLLENAAHAAGPGGWIEVSTSKRPGRVTIEVTDSGPGVPQAIRDRIFEPFFTTKPPGQGTGLGLSTSRDLVHRHGGTLELRARGERTVFAVDLPEPPEVS
ncbi:MAG TPA: ATP-binding protein, partial [Kofleriaceae bacterium]|nr:ATP-binding protein [Kofleriaceae bacterium]